MGAKRKIALHSNQHIVYNFRLHFCKRTEDYFETLIGDPPLYDLRKSVSARRVDAGSTSLYGKETQRGWGVFG